MHMSTTPSTITSLTPLSIHISFNTVVLHRPALIPIQTGTRTRSVSSSRRFARSVHVSHLWPSFLPIQWCLRAQFFSPLSFPDVLDLGLRVTHLGKSSVTYEVGVFKSSLGEEGKEDAPAAVGGYTHVFVDKGSRTSVAIDAITRTGLEKLVTSTTQSGSSPGAKL